MRFVLSYPLHYMRLSPLSSRYIFRSSSCQTVDFASERRTRAIRRGQPIHGLGQTALEFLEGSRREGGNFLVIVPVCDAVRAGYEPVVKLE